MSGDITLLLIDNDEVDRLTLQRSLRTAYIRATVHAAQNAAEGLRLLKKNRYDCIFIDYKLPDTDGITLLKRIREIGIDTPVLILTAQGDEKIAADALRNGASDYISKNLLPSEGISHSLRNAIKVYDAERLGLETKKAFTQSQRRLKEAHKLAKLGNWEINCITRKITWSDEIFNILEEPIGLPITYEEYSDRIHPDDREDRDSIFKRAISAKTQYQQDYRLILKSGKIKHVNVYGTPILDEAGNVKKVIGTLQDISDFINTRTALEESESKYRMLIETMNEGVLHVDIKQNIVFANQRFCEMMGYAKEEVIGQSLFMFIPDVKSRNVLIQKNFLRKKNIADQYEIKFKCKNGDVLGILISASPIKNQHGKIVGSMGILTDITERKKIEKALSSSEKLFRTLFENIQGLIFTHSLDGTILSINKAGATLIGLEAHNLEGRNLREYIAAEGSHNFADYLKDIATLNEATGILPIINQLNQNKHYLLYQNTLYKESGKEPYVIASAQDITQRIEIEKELTVAKQVAENSVKIKEQFLANMSHEIRTPMNGIIGLTGVLYKMIEDEEQKTFLQAIKSSADNLLIIINDILDFSKIDSGKMEFEQIYFNPKTLLRETINLFESRATEKNNKLKAIIDADVPDLLVGDPGKLTQVFNNLIGNSIKFTQYGEIKVFAEVIFKEADYVVLEFIVQDTGIGIPEPMLQSIFESFTQASSDTTRKYGGTGLGLTISKQLIELQGGTIKVKSILNEGSTFTFQLRFLKELAGTVPVILEKKDPVNASHLGKLHLLLAEDNEINQLLVRKIVSDWGFTLDIAPNGLKALDFFNQQMYDLILMDMQMPEVDGYEAIDYIRKSNDPKSTVPIIALTAHASQNEINKCLNAGADSHVSKPFNPEILLEEISKLVKQPVTFPLMQPEIIDSSDSSIHGPVPITNLAYLQEMAGGDREFMREIISMFIQQTPENIKMLLKFASGQNWTEVKSLAHKMKSSVVLIGVPDLIEIFTNLQKYAVSSEHTSQIPSMVDRANKLCLQAIIELKKELKLLNPPT